MLESCTLWKKWKKTSAMQELHQMIALSSSKEILAHSHITWKKLNYFSMTFHQEKYQIYDPRRSQCFPCNSCDRAWVLVNEVINYARWNHQRMQLTYQMIIFLTLDAANLSLVTHVTDHECLWMKLSTMPDETIKECNLHAILCSS